MDSYQIPIECLEEIKGNFHYSRNFNRVQYRHQPGGGVIVAEVSVNGQFATITEQDGSGYAAIDRQAVPVGYQLLKELLTE